MFFSRGTFAGHFRGIYNFERWNFAGRAFLESASAKYKISKFEISLKIQFYPPKRPLRDAFLAQNTILSARKPPAGRPQSEIYDIGTEIIIFHCFATKMLKSFCKSMIFSGICSIFCVLSFCSIKTWFKALWDIFSKICMRPWIRSLSNISPKRPLRDDIRLFPKRNIRHWDRNYNFPLFCHQNVKFVL